MWETTNLILHILVTQLQLHDVLEGSEECLVKVEVRKLCPAGQNLHQNIMDEGHSLLGYMVLFVAGSLGNDREMNRTQNNICLI